MQAIIFPEPIVTLEYLDTLPDDVRAVCEDILDRKKYVVKGENGEAQVFDVTEDRDEIPEDALYEDAAVILYCETAVHESAAIDAIHPNRVIRMAEDWVLLDEYVDKCIHLKWFNDRVTKLITLQAPTLILHNERKRLRKMIGELCETEYKFDARVQKRNVITLCKPMYMGENVSSQTRLIEAVFGVMHDRQFEVIPALDIVRETALRINSDDDFWAYQDISHYLHAITKANKDLAATIKEDDNPESENVLSNKRYIENTLWWMFASPINDPNEQQTNRPHSLYDFGLTIIKGKIVPIDEDE